MDTPAEANRVSGADKEATQQDQTYTELLLSRITGLCGKAAATTKTPATQVIEAAVAEHTSLARSANWTAEEHNKELHRLIINSLARKVDELQKKVDWEQEEQQALFEVLDRETLTERELSSLAADILTADLAIGACERLIRLHKGNERIERNVVALMQKVKKTSVAPEQPLCQ